ncbi:MAG: hypothetical protein LBP63_05260 [Prevotellaceae bacterium]|nr:hypothetical protein [Prevotellaceae bacterium]
MAEPRSTSLTLAMTRCRWCSSLRTRRVKQSRGVKSDNYNGWLRQGYGTFQLATVNC